MKNIILTGMPGAGKSSIGVILAKALGYEFIDSDLLIQKREGKKLSEIIAERGGEAFRLIEDDVNSSIECDNTVIATGGSICYCPEAMRHLSENGIIVYIDTDLESLESRVGDLGDRGVLMPGGGTLGDLYRERTPLYEKYADIRVDISGTEFKDAVALVLGKIKEVLNAEITE